MLRHQRRVTSEWVGRIPLASFSVSWGEKAKVYVISKNKELINTFESTEFDIELTQEVSHVIIIRQSRSQNICHIFQVVERYYGLDVVEIERFYGSKKAIGELMQAYNLAC